MCVQCTFRVCKKKEVVLQILRAVQYLSEMDPPLLQYTVVASTSAIKPSPIIPSIPLPKPDVDGKTTCRGRNPTNHLMGSWCGHMTNQLVKLTRKGDSKGIGGGTSDGSRGTSPQSE